MTGKCKLCLQDGIPLEHSHYLSAGIYRRLRKFFRWLACFRWRAIFTTNYDRAIERAYDLNPDQPQNPVSMYLLPEKLVGRRSLCEA
jgi:hypothetical protein